MFVCGNPKTKNSQILDLQREGRNFTSTASNSAARGLISSLLFFGILTPRIIFLCGWSAQNISTQRRE